MLPPPREDAPDNHAIDDSAPGREIAYWRALFHRWFIKYNPIYLVSAMLVLTGLNLLSRGLAREGSLYGPLGVAVVAELYAGALVGGAALLYRGGKRRPAVLMALLAVVYQGDLTLHTEMCGVLGTTGVAPTMVWLAAFVGKLFALGWALRLRLGWRAVAVAITGALGLAIGPYLLPRLGAEGAGTLVAAFALVLGALFPERLHESVTSRDALDAWGTTVLRRGVAATFAIWAVLLVLHVAFWASEQTIALFRVVPAIAAVLLAKQRHELRVWVIAVASVAFAAFALPAQLWFVAAIVTALMIVRALSLVPTRTWTTHGGADERSPYRVPNDEARDTLAPLERMEPVSPAERVRLWTGALVMGHLALWTFGWTGGSFPRHVWALDLAAALVTAVMVIRIGARVVLAYLAALLGHALVVAGLVPTPHSLVAWGGLALVLGFASLFVSILVSHRAKPNETSPS